MKFKTLTFGCQGRKKFISYKLDIGVSEADGHFYATVSDIPKEILDTSKKVLLKILNRRHIRGIEKVFAENLGELTSAIDRMMYHHEEVLRQEGSVKIILYRFRMTGDLTPDLSGSDKESLRYDDFSYDSGDLILGLDWHVLTKNTVGGETEYFYLRGTSFPDHYENSWKELKWTEAREKWFEGLEQSLRGMMLRVHEFMQIEPEKLQVAIDTGKFLPLIAGGSDGKKKK